MALFFCRITEVTCQDLKKSTSNVLDVARPFWINLDVLDISSASTRYYTDNLSVGHFGARIMFLVIFLWKAFH